VVNAIRSELLKLVGLPSVWAAVAVGLLVPPLVTLLNGTPPDPAGTADAGFQELALGVVGAIILGVVAIGNEYSAAGEESGGTRQIATSLTAVGSRGRFLVAKTAALVLTVASLAAVSAAATMTVTRIVLGDRAPAPTAGRLLGVILYWVLTALLAYGITLLTRSGVLPLAILILNTSVVSVSFLLSRAVPAAGYLPDLAGAHMFIHRIVSPVDIAPVTGGVVMAAWVVALLSAAGFVFHRRDA
jgi:ABC-type transport system involved in multi-copper enzyme maturation permease subunit